MKKIVLSSIALVALLSGCGSSSSCCSADESKSLVKYGKRAPVATITGLADNTTITTGQSVSVNGTTSSDQDGTVSTYNWKVDGVDSSTVANPTFTFDTAGSHEVCLSVTDNDNLNSANVECRTVIVKAPTVATPVTPTAVITFTDSDAPLVHFSNHTFSCADSHDNDTLGTGSEIVKCDWDIQSYYADGTPYRDCSADDSISHEVHICGSVAKIVATLTVTDNDGQTASTSTEYTEFSN